MKIKEFKENILSKRPVRPLRYRLTASFIMFAVILLAILWVAQSVFLSKYYEVSMEKKVKSSVQSIASLYSDSKSLTLDEFCSAISDVSEESDVMLYVEAADGSFSISSTDQSSGGRIFSNSRNLFLDVKMKMYAENRTNISYSFESESGETTIIYASLVLTESRSPIYVYAIASLTPVGPAVDIMRHQLLWVTLAALLLGAVISAFLSRRLAKPIIGMGENAKSLAKGNYDTKFEGGHEFREIDELAETLNETASELEKSDHLQKDLMANVSHDLRTPLTMIKSYAEMVRDLSGDDPLKRAEHLNVIIDETDRLSDLVNDVLVLSKMQAGVIEMKAEPFDIQKAAESVFSTFLVMEQEGYHLNLNTVPSEIIVTGDERRIKQVLANFLSNAVRYSSGVKEIKVSFEEKGEYIRCSVEDKGQGISEDDIGKIWNRYERVSSGGQRPQSGSSGLGLSIAAQILEKHGAKYGVESVLNEGSIFWFELRKS